MHVAQRFNVRPYFSGAIRSSSERSFEHSLMNSLLVQFVRAGLLMSLCVARWTIGYWGYRAWTSTLTTNPAGFTLTHPK
jgi:hypothetical protein